MKTRILTLTVSVLIAGMNAGWAAGTEHIKNGDFGSLDNWEPTETAAHRQLEPRNSSFTEVYPDNGQGVRVFGKLENRGKVLQQFINPIGAGKVEWNFDFYLPENSEAKAPGWTVALLDGSQKTFVAGMTLSSRFRLNSKDGAGGKILLHRKFKGGQWYHFRGTLDLENFTWSGHLINETGEDDSFVDEKFMDPGVDPPEVGGLAIAPMGVAADPIPMIFDNISLRQVQP